jgi:aryl-alcohol dehydrogenase-like predicted oxidoreductase
MARPGITAPIASATSMTQLDEIMRAPALNLSKENMAAFDQAST